MSKGFLALGSAFLAFALVLGSAAGADAQRRVRRERRDDRRDQVVEQLSGWNRLGERWVNHGVDRDHIVVTAVQGRFTRILIRVEHSALEMYNIRVTFADGSVFSPPTRLMFGQGGTTRTIDLPGGARAIRRVDFFYGNLPGGGRAQVELWAQ